MEKRIGIVDDGQAVEHQTLDEAKTPIRGLKNNNAAGTDKFLVELLKHGSEQRYQLLHRIILKILEEEELPANWLDGLICLLHKRASTGVRELRGITLLNSVYQIMFGILFDKLRSIEEFIVGKYQADFHEGLSTSKDQMFTLRQILDKLRGYNSNKLINLLIGFKTAYD